MTSTPPPVKKQLVDNIFQSLLGAGVQGTVRATPTKVVGAPGTAIFGGYPETDELNAGLVGRAKYKTYSDLLSNTSIVSAGVRYYLNLVSKAEWKVVAVDETPQAIEMKEFIEDAMDDMQTTWHRVIRRAAMYRFYGFSVQEWTAKRREDGKIGMLDVAPRAQQTIERWAVHEDGTVEGMIQRNPQNSVEIFLPRSKTIYIVDDSLNDSPEGLGLFRHLVEASDRLKRYEQLEGFGFETELRGIPVARVPLAKLNSMVANSEMTAADRTTLLTPIQSFIESHIKNPALGLILDSTVYESQDEAARPSSTKQWDMELLSSDGDSGQVEVAAAIQRLNHELARIMGVEGLLTGSDGTGSLALSKDKSLNFFLLVDSTLTEIKEVYENDYIDALWELNGFDDKLKPSFETEAIQFRDVQEITQALADLAKSGAMMAIDDPAIDEIRELLGLSPQPEVSEDDLRLTGGDQTFTPTPSSSEDRTKPKPASKPDEDELPKTSGDEEDK